MARVDRPGRRPALPDLRAHRYRPRCFDLLAGHSRAGQAAQDRSRASGRAGAGQGHRPAGDPDLDTGGGRPGLRGHQGLGRAALQDDRLGGARPGELEVGCPRGGGLARLDYTQNVSNKTLVAPYSPRAAPGAPVSAPIAWEELDDPALRPDGFTIRTVLGRVAELGDLFGAVLREGQQLPPLE